jgi:hypothetical protein
MDRFSDLSKNPPGAAFRRILGIPPPAGVSEIRVAGYAPFNGDGCMTFRAREVESVLNAIKRGERGLRGPGPGYNDWQTHPEKDPHIAARPEFQEWLTSVGWERIEHIDKAEHYQFGTTSGWAGGLVVDRPRKLIFVYGQIY